MVGLWEIRLGGFLDVRPESQATRLKQSPGLLGRTLGFSLALSISLPQQKTRHAAGFLGALAERAGFEPAEGY